MYEEYGKRFFGLQNIYWKFADVLKNITGEAIKNALQRVRDYYPKLPTPDQFKSLCRDKTVAIENLERIRQIIKNPPKLTDEEKEQFIKDGERRSFQETQRIRAYCRPLPTPPSTSLSPLKHWTD